jgi:hypothetical protein
MTVFAYDAQYQNSNAWVGTQRIIIDQDFNIANKLLHRQADIDRGEMKRATNSSETLRQAKGTGSDPGKQRKRNNSQYHANHMPNSSLRPFRKFS